MLFYVCFVAVVVVSLTAVFFLPLTFSLIKNWSLFFSQGKKNLSTLYGNKSNSKYSS